MKRKRIIFRVDGNKTIGYGHVIRCLALAQILQSKFECSFSSRTSDPFLSKTIKDAGFSIYNLPESKKHFSAFIELLTGTEIVVLDNYFFDTDYQSLIKNRDCKLVCIDDTHDKHFVADAVINHAEGIKKNEYSKAKYTQLCLGYRYAMLRPEFLDKTANARVFSAAPNVLISLGGTDPIEIVKKVTDTFLKHDTVNSVTLISKFDASLFENPGQKRFEILQNLTADQLASEMIKADFGFFPSSTISVEACACRLPLITGWFAENQINIYRAQLNNGICIGAGNINVLSERELALYINTICIENRYLEILKRQSILLDGKSGERLLQVFTNIAES